VRKEQKKRGRKKMGGLGGNDTLKGGSDSLNTHDGVNGNDVAKGGPGNDHCSTDPGDQRVRCP
jgi:Ca2+-binding RTX toxin-like protein